MLNEAVVLEDSAEEPMATLFDPVVLNSPDWLLKKVLYVPVVEILFGLQEISATSNQRSNNRCEVVQVLLAAEFKSEVYHAFFFWWIIQKATLLWK